MESGLGKNTPRAGCTQKPRHIIREWPSRRAASEKKHMAKRNQRSDGELVVLRGSTASSIAPVMRGTESAPTGPFEFHSFALLLRRRPSAARRWRMPAFHHFPLPREQAIVASAFRS